MEKKMPSFNPSLASISEKLGKIEQDVDYEVGDTYLANDAVRPLVASNCTEFVVAYSKHGLRPVRQFSEVSLLPHIVGTMQKLGLSRLQRIQSYTWPHLGAGNGHGVFIVGAPRSGRTFGYIPPLCDVVCRVLAEGRRLRGSANWYPNQEGAVAVILVPDAVRVRQVSALCHALLRKARNEESFTLTLNVEAPVKPQLFHRLLNGVGCLVVTPAQLVGLQQAAPGLLRFPRLQFVVYDDVDLMPPKQLQAAEQALLEFLPRDRYPQMVMVSQFYDRKLMAKLTGANSHPALIFGDILEAAVYGGTRVRIVLCPLKSKIEEVFRLLQQRPPKEYRTVIYCADDVEMRSLVAALEYRCHSCLPYYQTADLEARERVQRWLAKSHGMILLCTDNCPELEIRHAHTLIHYGLSGSWSKFKMRHLALSGSLNKRLGPSEPNPEALSLHSLVLLDDKNQRQLPRLVDFLRQHQEVDPAIIELVTKMRQEMEKERGNHNVVCRQIMVKGECIETACEERHHVTDSDRCPASVPSSGDVKVQLVKVYSPTHFCVHLVEHLPPQGSWKTFPPLAAQDMSIQLLQNPKPSRYWPPVPGAICMYHHVVKERVRVLQVAPIKSSKLVRTDLEVLLQAIDLDTRVFRAKSGRLYECPEELQKVPAMAIDLRLLGLVPFSGERTWTEEARSRIENKLAHLPKEHFLQVHILFATAHTIFARNLVAMTYAASLKMHTRHLSLSLVLIADKLAKRCEETENKILAFFKAGEEEEDEEVQRDIREVELQAEKDQTLQRKQKEDKKENESPNKASALLINKVNPRLALPRANEKQLQEEEELLEQEVTKLEQKVFQLEQKVFQLEHKEEPHQAEESLPIPEEEPKPRSNEEGMAQLYECLMKCSLLDMEEAKEREKEKEMEKNPGEPASSSLEFLELLVNGGAQTPTKPNNKIIKAKAIKAASQSPRDKPSKEMHAQLPPKVVRPTTTYYQTLTTLELHVLLPEEVQMYAAVLEKGQAFFWATCQASDLNHQFVLTLSFPYSSLSHRKCGRTVYISVQKARAALDPLNFGAYPFMKPNHEMFAKLDDQQAKEVTKIEESQKDRSVVPQSIRIEEEEDSCDDEKTPEGVELPGQNKMYED